MSQSMELAVGSPAPVFRLPADTGVEVGLVDYAGKSNVVLFFVREFA